MFLIVLFATLVYSMTQSEIDARCVEVCAVRQTFTNCQAVCLQALHGLLEAPTDAPTSTDSPTTTETPNSTEAPGVMKKNV